jgi:hypothetical protein
MESYKIMNDQWNHVMRESDGALIPQVRGNPDYDKFLTDIATGSEVTLFDWDTENERRVKNEVDKKIQETELNIKKELFDNDIKSIRSIREYIANKSDAPQLLKDLETKAITERGKLK